MPFTTFEVNQVLKNIQNAALANTAEAQNEQKMPLREAMLANKGKPFTGGTAIKVALANRTDAGLKGFESNVDAIDFTNPNPISWAEFPYFDHYNGLIISRQELLVHGISITTEKLSGKRNVPGSEKIALLNMLTEKEEEKRYGNYLSQQRLLWGDGSTDPKALIGLTAFIRENPEIGTVGGVNSATNAWWRNRAVLNIAATSANAASTPMLNVLNAEARQITKFGGGKMMRNYAGSDMIAQLESEINTKGTYTQTGFNKNINVGKGDIVLYNGEVVQYDPMLDQMGKSKYLYIVDHDAIKVSEYAGEGLRDHEVERDQDKFVFTKAWTWVAGMTAKRLNSSGVYSIA